MCRRSGFDVYLIYSFALEHENEGDGRDSIKFKLDKLETSRTRSRQARISETSHLSRDFNMTVRALPLGKFSR